MIWCTIFFSDYFSWSNHFQNDTILYKSDWYTLVFYRVFEGISSDCDSNGDTTVALGESKTCTLTNNDQQATITVVKKVINDNGGTAVPSDWTLTAAGYDPVSPDAGTYDLSESGPANYSLASLTCDNAAGQVTSVTLGLGEDVKIGRA